MRGGGVVGNATVKLIECVVGRRKSLNASSTPESESVIRQSADDVRDCGGNCTVVGHGRTSHCRITNRVVGRRQAKGGKYFCIGHVGDCGVRTSVRGIRNQYRV